MTASIGVAVLILVLLVAALAVIGYGVSLDDRYARNCVAAGGHIYDPQGSWDGDPLCTRDGLLVEVYP